jgi:magnesium-transporting ATPase (P-type)
VSNPLILWGIIVEIGLILIVVYTPWGNLAFGTRPLDAEAWLFALPFAAVMVMLEEGRKAFARRRASLRDHGAAA